MMFEKTVTAESHSGCVHQPQAANEESSPRAVSNNDLRRLGPQAQLIRKIQKARSRRKDFLSSTLFGEPAWDMLLELFASAVEQKRVTIGDLCAASKVPQTTALRWMDVLLRQGLVTRRPDPLDSRRVHVEMTPSAYSAMRDYAEQLSGTVLAA
jgi:hypothetical protein